MLFCLILGPMWQVIEVYHMVPDAAEAKPMHLLMNLDKIEFGVWGV